MKSKCNEDGCDNDCIRDDDGNPHEYHKCCCLDHIKAGMTFEKEITKTVYCIRCTCGNDIVYDAGFYHGSSKCDNCGVTWRYDDGEIRQLYQCSDWDDDGSCVEEAIYKPDEQGYDWLCAKHLGKHIQFQEERLARRKQDYIENENEINKLKLILEEHA